MWATTSGAAWALHCALCAEPLGLALRAFCRRAGDAEDPAPLSTTPPLRALCWRAGITEDPAPLSTTPLLRAGCALALRAQRALALHAWCVLAPWCC